MARILAIDYGQKRVGIAVTDPLKLIANPLITVHTKDIFNFLKEYISKEEVELIIVGEAKQLDNKPAESSKYIEPFVDKLKKIFPNIRLMRIDERFTSKIAFRAMVEGRLRKKDRQNKALIDMISATLILQSYLETLSQTL